MNTVSREQVVANTEFEVDLKAYFRRDAPEVGITWVLEEDWNATGNGTARRLTELPTPPGQFVLKIDGMPPGRHRFRGTASSGNVVDGFVGPPPAAH